MSLDTILKIGKAFRQSDNSLKYFKYVEPCPKEKGNYPLCISIPIDKDFSAIWDKCYITPQKECDKLYYLKFKTSESDGFVKYIYGDIYYKKSASIKRDGTIETGQEDGYYRLSNPKHPNLAFRLSSFNRGTADFNNIISDSIEQDITFLSQFRTFTKNNLELIERMLEYPSAVQYFFLNKNDIQYSFEELVNDEDLLRNYTILQNQKIISKSNAEKINVDLDNLDAQMKSKLIQLTNCRIFLHFDFSVIGKKYWYEYKEALDIVSKKMLSEFVDRSEDGYVLKKALYKTLCSGDKKNDIQFPNFSINNKYKSKCFIDDEIEDLFYALSYTNKGFLISGTDIKLIILPRGQNLTAKDYEDFQEKMNERSVVANNNYDNSLFSFSDNAQYNITSFDLIFCKKGGLSSPDKDVIEISCVEKSKLRMIREKIDEISKEINKERKIYIGTDKELKALSIEYSFKELLGTPIFKQNAGKIEFDKNPMYQSHLLKVLPQIYTDNYFDDEILLPSFIQNTEFSIRSGDNKFKFLKFDLIFLLRIQNNKTNKYMEITESKSYEIGLLLGELAKNISQEINSFEKSYVGTLTRRICNLSDFIKLKTDIEQKLVLHDKSKYTYQISYTLSQKIKGI
jgi:hypothetical protein